MPKAIEWIKAQGSAVSLFVKENKNLLIVLMILEIICALIWRFSCWHDFGLNAFTEVMGIVLTVFVIDQIIKRQESRRLFPLQAAAFSDVGLFINEIVSFWHNAYNWSVPNPSPPTHPKDLFTLPYFDAIRKHLNLDAQPNVSPPRTWWQFLPQQEKNFLSLGEKILERHAAVLDPYAYSLVHKIINHFLNQNIGLNMIGAIYQADQLSGIQRPHTLEYYWIALEDALKEVADLYEWYHNNHPEYLKRL